MTENLGEEIVAAYLQYIKRCEFIQRNLYTADAQGEIDVVGIDLESKTLYVCEVAVHLITGLQYTKGSHPNNVQKLTDKFGKDIEYANRFFPDYTKHFMLWSPIVKTPAGPAKHSQMADIETVKACIEEKYGVSLECIINDAFAGCLSEMRTYAGSVSEELKSPVLRFMQIEAYLGKHLGKRVKVAQ
jgi:hypothetical protein